MTPEQIQAHLRATSIEYRIGYNDAIHDGIDLLKSHSRVAEAAEARMLVAIAYALLQMTGKF